MIIFARIIDEATKEAAVVDPVEPHSILRVAQENGVDLKLVLTTHHHWLVSFSLDFSLLVYLLILKINDTWFFNGGADQLISFSLCYPFLWKFVWVFYLCS